MLLLITPFPNFRNGSVKPPLNLGHGWVIISQDILGMLLLISNLIANKLCWWECLLKNIPQNQRATFPQNWLPVRLSESQIISLLIPTVLSVSLVVHGSPLLTARCWWAIMLLSIAIVWLLGCFVVLLFYEQNTKFPTFKVWLSHRILQRKIGTTSAIHRKMCMTNRWLSARLQYLHC